MPCIAGLAGSDESRAADAVIAARGRRVRRRSARACVRGAGAVASPPRTISGTATACRRSAQYSVDTGQAASRCVHGVGRRHHAGPARARGGAGAGRRAYRRASYATLRPAMATATRSACCNSDRRRVGASRCPAGNNLHYATGAFLDALLKVPNVAERGRWPRCRSGGADLSRRFSAYAQHEPAGDSALSDALMGSHPARGHRLHGSQSPKAPGHGTQAHGSTALKRRSARPRAPTVTGSAISVAVPQASWTTAAWLVVNAQASQMGITSGQLRRMARWTLAARAGRPTRPQRASRSPRCYRAD